MTESKSIVRELTGDLFELAPNNAVLVHACNTRGQWGAGIAKRFKELYPNAYAIYNHHCKSATGSILGTTLLIPPQAGDLPPGGTKQRWIACLFTSEDFGRRKGSPGSILEATRSAVGDLKEQVEGLRRESEEDGEGIGGKGPGEVWACRFNSKNFGVPWERSKGVVEEVGLGMVVVEFGY